MVELSRDIQDRMNNVAFHFSHELRMKVHATLKEDKYRSSGYLESSVRVSVKEANAYEPPVIMLEFEEYGEFIGKRKLLFPKQPPVDKLKEWVEREGLADSSAPVPGYKNGAPKLPAFKRAERIAFAIAISKKKDTVKFRRKAWKKESFPDVLKAMNEETYAQFAVHIERLFKESLENLQ